MTQTHPQLDWQFSSFREWVLTAPILTSRGQGDYEIHIVPRPTYCDRGDWLTCRWRLGSTDALRIAQHCKS